MASAREIRQPLAQALPEVAFEAGGNCMRIQFEDDQFFSWCGIFGQGAFTGSQGRVCPLVNADFAVLFAGRLYRVNANTRQLYWASAPRSLSQILYSPDHDLIVTTDKIHLYVYARNGMIWQSERTCEFSIEEVLDDRVVGIARDFFSDTVPFTLFLNPLQFHAEKDLGEIDW